MYALKSSKKVNPLWWAGRIANGIEDKRENQQGQEIIIIPTRTSAIELVSVPREPLQCS